MARSVPLSANLAARKPEPMSPYWVAGGCRQIVKILCQALDAFRSEAEPETRA
jgi:hypothetical protein